MPSAPLLMAVVGPDTAIAPPHNLEAEQSVLGAILLSDRALYGLVIEDGLRPEDFYRERHARVYAAMLDLYGRSEPVDPLTVTEHLKQSGLLDDIGGPAAVAGLTGSVPAVGNVRHYAEIVRSNALMRRLLSTTYDIQASVIAHEAAPRDLVERAERAMLEVAHDDRQKDFQSIEDVLLVELEKLQRLSKERTALTGTPSGFTDLDEITGGFQPGNLVIVAARPSMGKCQPGSALVYDPMSGARRRLDAVVEAHERGEAVWVAALGPDFRLRPARVSAGLRSGVQPVLRITTRLGRRIEATPNHPLLTVEGWREVGELAPGARIAVPRHLPQRGEPQTMPDHEIVLLAALLADGALGGATPRFFAGARSPMLPEVLTAAEAMGARAHVADRDGAVQVDLAGPGGRVANPVTELCRRHGVMGKRSAEKFVPDAVFGLHERQIARFLSVLYGCDGHLHVTDRLRQIGYTTISARLARDVQHLLLRLGIVGRIRSLARPVYDGTGKEAREVLITGEAGVGAFCELVGAHGKEGRARAALAGLAGVRTATNVDTVPKEVWPRSVDARGQRTWRQLSAATGRPESHNWHVGARGLSRGLLEEIATWTGDAKLSDLATSDVWWDEIASVEPIGEHETFDLTVPGDHNFVADDVIVHNSALVCNIAENAALEHGRAVALFSLEMSEAELAQRFVASQARIKGEELRKGRVADAKWPKILQASQRLAQAQLFIDDSSDLGLLEIRAKARRLHHQQPDGLGLVIVDYLQLMRPDGRVESRVQQVGEMSRGLKMLARELGVPVVALSQLSRAVETRSTTDKRPQLSDLRESGSIEQDADLVIFIYRDEYYNEDSEREGEADLLIAKHRNGAIGDVTLTFQKEYPKFSNYAGERFAP